VTVRASAKPVSVSLGVADAIRLHPPLDRQRVHPCLLEAPKQGGPSRGVGTQPQASRQPARHQGAIQHRGSSVCMCVSAMAAVSDPALRACDTHTPVTARFLHCLVTAYGWAAGASSSGVVRRLDPIHPLLGCLGQQKRAAPVGSALAESVDAALISALPPLSEGSIRDTGTDRGLRARSTTQPARVAGGRVHVELV
jgi:hypothetical protein